MTSSNRLSAATEYVRAGGTEVLQIKGTWGQYLYHDHLGSRVAMADSAAGIWWNEAYNPYGEKRIDPDRNKDNLGFAGHVQDDVTGLTYMQARYYDPVTGRFLSADPVQFSPGAPQMFNRYSYVANDPINGIDPDGRKRITASLGGKVTAVVGIKGGVSVTFDTKGKTLSGRVEVGPRTGAAGKIKGGISVSESNGFAKSDVKIGIAVDVGGSAVVANRGGEASGAASLRDGFSGTAEGTSSLGVEGEIDLSDGTGKFEADLGLGADAGVTFSAEVSISGAEIKNGFESIASGAAEAVTNGVACMQDAARDGGGC